MEVEVGLLDDLDFLVDDFVLVFLSFGCSGEETCPGLLPFEEFTAGICHSGCGSFVDGGAISLLSKNREWRER